MNLHFIGKEFERLERLEDFINYQYEPKSNKRLGKRNIYFEDLKLDFINEVNTYGFSPFILKNFGEQRDDPNIMRYMTKAFNHGLTNYVKLKTQAITHHSKNEIKKYISQKKKKLNLIKKPKKLKKIISSIYLIKKNEEKKVEEVRENFLQKALQGMGGHKLNISMDEEEDNKDKEKEKENKVEEEISKKVEASGEDKDHNIINKNDISSYNETKKGILLFDSNKKNFMKKNTQELPKVLNNNLKNKTINRKSVNLNLEDILVSNKLRNKKKVSYLSKNKDIIKEKVFTPENGNTITKFELDLDSIKPKRKLDREKTYLKKFTKKKIINKNEFLLFTKARPYRYMTSEGK